MNKTLITPSEVVKYSGIKLSANPCDYRTILNIEFAEFRKRLTIQFYEDLKVKLADYSSAVEFNGQSVAANTVVKFNGVYYKAKETTTERPDNISKWDLAPKFTVSNTQNDCGAAYETLFCDYLAEYLALSVMFIQLPFIANQTQTEGVLSFNGQHYESKDDKAVTRLQLAVQSKREMVFENMMYHMKNTEGECFSHFKNDSECGCDTVTKSKQRFGYDFA